MTLPSKFAQENLIRSVYVNAGLDISTTNYVEAHGTGTPAGDPVEAGAIAAAWSERKSEVPLYIGAIKSNIGHLEGASGVAGLIKTVQALEKAIIPPNINFEKVNSKIFPDKWNIEVRFCISNISIEGSLLTHLISSLCIRYLGRVLKSEELL
jgi:acyl transferase domain-containing protein